MTDLTRRGFSRAIAGAFYSAGAVHGEAAEPWAADPIVDCHHHLRRAPEASITHLDGCRVSNALFLTRAASADTIQAIRTGYPG